MTTQPIKDEDYKGCKACGAGPDEGCECPKPNREAKEISDEERFKELWEEGIRRRAQETL